MWQDQFAYVLSGTVKDSEFTTAKRSVGIGAGSICVCPFRYSTRSTSLPLLPREGLALWQYQFASVLSFKYSTRFRVSKCCQEKGEQWALWENQFASVLSGTVQGTKAYHFQEKGGHCGRINLRLSFQVQYKVQSLQMLPRDRWTLWQGTVRGTELSYHCFYSVREGLALW